MHTFAGQHGTRIRLFATAPAPVLLAALVSGGEHSMLLVWQGVQQPRTLCARAVLAVLTGGHPRTYLSACRSMCVAAPSGFPCL